MKLTESSHLFSHKFHTSDGPNIAIIRNKFSIFSLILLNLQHYCIVLTVYVNRGINFSSCFLMLLSLQQLFLGSYTIYVCHEKIVVETNSKN